jgi:hypothetical protein
MPSPQRSPIPTTKAAAKVIGVPPAAVTSSSLSATTVLPTIGRWQVSSNATCAWTTTCLFVTWVRPAMSHRQASCATCWIRRSTRSNPSSRRLRSVATPATGKRSSVRFRASTSKARSTADPTTGRSGVGTRRVLAKPSVRPSVHPTSRPSVPDRLSRLRRLNNQVLDHKAPGSLSAAARDHSVRDPAVARDPAADPVPGVLGAHPSADRGLRVPAGRQQADHVPPVQAGLPAHLHPAPVAHLGVRFGQPTHARPFFSRSKERGGSDTPR